MSGLGFFCQNVAIFVKLLLFVSNIIILDYYDIILLRLCFLHNGINCPFIILSLVALDPHITHFIKFILSTPYQLR